MYVKLRVPYQKAKQVAKALNGDVASDMRIYTSMPPEEAIPILDSLSVDYAIDPIMESPFHKKQTTEYFRLKERGDI